MDYASLMPRFQRAMRALPKLESHESWSRDWIRARQLNRLNRLWSHAVAHVPHYRALQQEVDLPPQFESIEAFTRGVPVLEKTRVRDDPQRFLSEARAPGRWRRTGGSTGLPMNVYWGHDAHAEMLTARYRYYQAWGIDIFDRTAMLWGASGQFRAGLAGVVSRVRTPLEDRLRNRLRLSAYSLDHDTLQRYLERLAEFRPVALYGYSSAIHLLATEALASGFDGSSLKLVTMTGESAPAFMQESVARAFGATVTLEYGAAEAPVIASQMPDGALRVREDMVLVETLPRADGRHDIVLTALTNPSFPLLRYRIDDVTDQPLAETDRGFSALHNVVGRSTDFIVTPAGRQLHAARFDAFFKYEAPGVRQFRLRQDITGTVVAQLETDVSLADRDALARRLSRLLDGATVTVEIADRLPQTPAGKNRLVVSAFTAPTTAAPASVTPPARPRTTPTAPAAAAPGESKSTRLRRLLMAPQLTFLMEAHNGLSAKIAEESGFEGIWASGLAMSAALGVRDSNEATWTQVLEVLEFMTDATSVPILLDGDTGYGNFNTMRRLVHKLEQRGVAGVCIEDKIFPKTNSFLRSEKQQLADPDEFAGRIKAGKDAAQCDAFVIVARVEALIAGWGLEEALYRAETYRQAGADAILIHSRQAVADEVIAFKEAWGDRAPVLIVPTKYYTTPTMLFRQHGFSAVIWANHLLRASLGAMQQIAARIHADQTLVGIEPGVAPLAEVFRIQGDAELEEAERRYLPAKAAGDRVRPQPTDQRPTLVHSKQRAGRTGA